MSDTRVLGKRLGQRVNQEAIVLGRITEKSSEGKSAEITTTDDARVNVTFLEPLTRASNLSDYVEVHGTVKSKSTMSCSRVIYFPPDMSKDFDTNSYNTMMNMRCAVEKELEGGFYGD